MNNTPLVSVLMTAYNRERYIAEAIESVINSTYQNWELIIVDDGSKDNTVAIARSYAAKDKRIRFYQNERNLGDYPNRNMAASYANGDYLVYVDSDDWMLKDTLAKWIKLIQYHQVHFGIFVPGFKKEPLIFEPKTSIMQHFFDKAFLMSGPGATIIAKVFFDKINGFPEKYGPANDMYYNLKVASKTPVLIIPFPLGDYRRHDGQEINNRYSYLYNNYCYLRDALIELNLPLTDDQKKYLHQKNKRRFATNCVRYLFDTKNFSKTRQAVRLAEFGLKDWWQALFNKKMNLPAF